MQSSHAWIFDQKLGRWLIFSQPTVVLQADAVSDVLPALAEADRLVRQQRLWAAGFLAYEAAPAFDPAMRTHPKGFLPLLWLGLFPEPVVGELPPAKEPVQLPEWRTGQTESEYRRVIDQIKAHIARGDTYQVNYTLRMHSQFGGDPWAFFLSFAASQRGGPAGFLQADRFAICSASPELFFDLDGDRLRSRPMKGTKRRGLSSAEDAENAAWLASSEKNRAENVMIVDMVRNDMGRIAATGSVQVPDLFTVERYPTVLQMTSTVICSTRASIPEIFGALFPCASITGAPKIRTMDLISGLESSPRGVYTGAIGFWGPEGRAQFNVAIRTAVLDLALGRAEYGTGSGIVWDSDPDDEYRECLLKTRVLGARRPLFDLLESLRWEPGDGFFLLDRHMERLAASSEYFGYCLVEEKVRAALERAVSGRNAPARVRLLLSEDGDHRVEVTDLAEGTDLPVGLLELAGLQVPQTAAFAPQPVHRSNVTLYHKTTHRLAYEAAQSAHPEVDQVLLWNEAGEATEFATANLVVRIGEELFTPPVSCGLLPGTLRAELLACGAIHERVVRLEELAEIEGVWAVNSVRGWQAVTFPAGLT